MVADPKLLPGFADDSDFKGYSRKHGVVTADHQLRAVAAGTAQLHLLREQIRALCDEKSPYRQKQGLLSKPDVEKEDVACFESFYAESFYYPALLDLHGTVRRCADMSFLWYREYHLELMHCVQVPVESSLPWILAENCVAMQAHGHRRGTPGDAAGTGAGAGGGAGTVTGGALPAVENIFYLLDVYNDAADAALRLFRRPYLFEEIEAEAGLAAEHLVASLIDESYVYYKNLAASRLLDPAFVKRLDPSLFAVGVRGYSEVLRQRQVALVGRHVNVSAAAVRHFHASLFRDIDAAIRRFEAGDACGVVRTPFPSPHTHTHPVASTHLGSSHPPLLVSCATDGAGASTERPGRITRHAPPHRAGHRFAPRRLRRDLPRGGRVPPHAHGHPQGPPPPPRAICAVF